MATEGRIDREAPAGIEQALQAVRSRHELVAVLLAADLFMPATATVEGTGRVRRVDDAAAVRYPVIVQGGERLVPVFSSEAGVLAALPDPDRPYVVARGVVLLAGWPPDAALYLDPGGMRSTKLPGSQVAALRADVLRAADPPAVDHEAAGIPATRHGEPLENGTAGDRPVAPRRSLGERLGLRRPS